MEDALVITASRYQVAGVLKEAAVSYMRGVASEFDILAAVHWAWVPEEFDLSEVIGRGEYRAFGAPITSIDITSVSGRREYALDRPSQCAGP